MEQESHLAVDNSPLPPNTQEAVGVSSNQVQSSVQPQVTYAGFWVRYAAFVVDGLILLLFRFSIFIPAIIFIRDVKDLPSDFSYLVVYSPIIIYFLIQIILITKFGATLGKMFFGIKIVDKKGNVPNLKTAVIREIPGKIISGIPLSIGYLWVAFDKEKQAIHDKWAGTHVIFSKPLSKGKKVLVFIFAILPIFGLLGIMAASFLIFNNP